MTMGPRMSSVLTWGPLLQASPESTAKINAVRIHRPQINISSFSSSTAYYAAGKPRNISALVA